MAATIKPKRSSTPSAAPVIGDLVEGEIALNIVDGRLYCRDNASNVVEVGLNPSGNVVMSGTLAVNGGVISANGGCTVDGALRVNYNNDVCALHIGDDNGSATDDWRINNDSGALAFGNAGTYGGPSGSYTTRLSWNIASSEWDITGGLDISAALTVGGLTDLNGALEVASTSTLTGAVTCSNLLTIDRSTTPIFTTTLGANVLSGDDIFKFIFYGEDSTNVDRNGIIMQGVATETWGRTAQGLKMVIEGKTYGTGTSRNWFTLQDGKSGTAGMGALIGPGTTPLFNINYATLTLCDSGGGVLELTDDVTDTRGRMYYNSNNGLFINNAGNLATAGDDISFSIAGTTGRVKGVVYNGSGSPFSSGSASIMEGVTALPGTPDSDTIYFVI